VPFQIDPLRIDAQSVHVTGRLTPRRAASANAQLPWRSPTIAAVRPGARLSNDLDGRAAS